jgi:hypothetical protein
MENGEPVPDLRRHGPSCVLGEWRCRADRRANAHSRLSAVVVRFSRSKRFERQGILVEELALECAEQELLRR